MRKVESIECVRLNPEASRQNLGFSSRPFVLCGQPVKRRHPVASSMSEGTTSLFCRSVGIRATVCHRGRIDWFPYFCRPSRSGKRVRGSLFAVAVKNAQMMHLAGLGAGKGNWRRSFHGRFLPLWIARKTGTPSALGSRGKRASRLDSPDKLGCTTSRRNVHKTLVLVWAAATPVCGSCRRLVPHHTETFIDIFVQLISLHSSGVIAIEDHGNTAFPASRIEKSDE
jgi:hypothetical protein